MGGMGCRFVFDEGEFDKYVVKTLDAQSAGG